MFVGDSITDAGRDRSRPDSLGDGYVSLVAPELPGSRIINAGIAGDRVRDLSARWERDVLSQSPSTLTVYVGVNDTWRRFDDGDPTTSQEFEDALGDLLDVWPRDHAPRLILMEPFLLPVRSEQREWLDDLAGKRRAVAAVAAELGASFVPLHGILSEAAAGVGGEVLAPDGVHPTATGSRIIADAWLDAYSGRA